MQRRDLLAAVGRRAAVVALAQLFALPAGSRSATIERFTAWDDPFTLGVASGMPGPGSALLWTRLAPRPREPLGGMPEAAVWVDWEVADDEGFTVGVVRGRTLAEPEHAHSVHVEVTGLRSDRRYFYRFRCGDAQSPTGRTRTAPTADALPGQLRIALASCQHYEQGLFTVHREIAERELDLVVFVGDYLYESSRRDVVRPHEGPKPTTLEGYRQRHVTYKLDADLRACHAAHPWLLTWDDHEVENDYAGSASIDPARTASDFLALRTAAYKAYFEHMPLSPRARPGPQGLRLHEHHRWGRLADLWTLDNRQHRSAQACNAPGMAGGRMLIRCDGLEDPAQTMLGAPQEAWLADGLGASRSAWRLLAQSTQIAPGGINTPLGRSVYTDGWDGYPKARERLMQTIAAQPHGNVVCLGGDLHRHTISALRADPRDLRTPVLASEVVTTSVTSKGLSGAATHWVRDANPDTLHARSNERGYAFLELTPERLLCDLRATRHPVEAQARLHSQARYIVESGRPTPLQDG